MEGHFQPFPYLSSSYWRKVHLHPDLWSIDPSILNRVVMAPFVQPNRH